MMLISVEMPTQGKKKFSQNHMKVVLIHANKIDIGKWIVISHFDYIYIYILNKEFYFGVYFSFT